MLRGLSVQQTDFELSEVYKTVNSKYQFRKRLLQMYYTSPTLLFSNDYLNEVKMAKKIGGELAQLVQWFGYEWEDRKLISS